MLCKVRRDVPPAEWASAVAEVLEPERETVQSALGQAMVVFRLATLAISTVGQRPTKNEKGETKRTLGKFLVEHVAPKEALAAGPRFKEWLEGEDKSEKTRMSINAFVAQHGLESIRSNRDPAVELRRRWAGQH